MKKIPTKEQFTKFVIDSLLKEGMSREYSEMTAEVLVTTDMFGTHSHGTKNLHNYIKKMRLDGMKMDGDIEIINQGVAFTLIDAANIIGMVPATKAMELAIKKSETTGIAISVVKNAAHFGAAGYYALMAAKANKIGIVFSNVDANMTIPGARGKVIGNNPLAYAVPSGKYPPIFLDIAMSNVASLKVIKAKHDKQSIPMDWIVDGDGKPTDDPSNYPEAGAMQPLAAHKGYGLALMTEILTGVLSGGGVMGEVPSWLFSLAEPNNVSHTFISIDVDKFTGSDNFSARIEQMIDKLHETPKAQGSDRIYYPGEMEWDNYARNEKQGITLPPDVLAALEDLSADNGIELPLG